MKKQIIALRGKSNVGKSTTLQLLYKLLLADPQAKTVKFSSIGRKLDFLAIVSIDGAIVGLFNRGDTPDSVEDLLQELVDAKCDVIVCAARTKGEVDNVLETHRRKYEVLHVAKEARGGTSESASNLAAAHGLAAAIYSAIDS